MCAVYMVNRLQINSMATVVGPGAQTSLVPTLVGEKQMLNEQLYISAIYLKPMTNASNTRPWFWVDMTKVWGVEGQGNFDAEDWKLVRREESQAEEECGQRPGLGKTMKNFRNSHQAELFASIWVVGAEWRKPGSTQQQGVMAGVSRDREGHG